MEGEYAIQFLPRVVPITARAAIIHRHMTSMEARRWRWGNCLKNFKKTRCSKA